MKDRLLIRDFFEYFDPGCPYHLSSMNELQEAIDKADPSILKNTSSWFRTWSQSGKRNENRKEWIHPWYKHTNKI